LKRFKRQPKDLGISNIKQVNIDLIMGTLKYKGYSGTLEYSEQDNCLFGKVMALKAQMTGRSINAIIKDMLTNQQDLLNA
jgi:predicted HicB family RNase H-like nuclease